ncbi:uncharacterized protein BYT42DRAFT_503824 [Radiomyces spectabilis]|uniref:uncharacterized protein n=1 Tax=Radiomyces spectabilis TaxID=64574 RepID=UPI00221E826C|nr:uncharacterized protein BYT42DRAFT_503824 [Radiomyces spectabilis]KAI8368226.1 hypothetical protein BYT42DRAFT_503824 [Radiomyces spectabilis]
MADSAPIDSTSGAATAPSAEQRQQEEGNTRRRDHRRRDHRRPPRSRTPQQQTNEDDKEDKSQPRKRHPRKKPQNKGKPVTSSAPPAPKKEATESSNSEDERELCFICTEPIVNYAVSACDHRTCHLCSLRLRCLYKTFNCAYCKTEQKTVIYTKDSEKPFAQFTNEEVPIVDKKLNARFEDEQIYQDCKLLLQYNCPEPSCDVACDGGWSELKRHTKKEHDLLLCDLCIRYKKIFAHEHTLYTAAQLHKHYKSGDLSFNKDDETGFTGHPECQFCKMSFYGDDELYEHCRDKHEQCHICVRHGIRHEYYMNYDELESHFKRDHYLCLYRECLDKKFVVFESDIDLKGHEVEVHGASIAGLQRAKQAEARRVNVNFQYSDASYRQRERTRNKGKRSDDQANSREGTSASASSASTAQPTSELRSEDFPTMTSVANALQASSSGETSQSKKGKKKGIEKPKGFGALSAATNELAGSSAAATSAPVDTVTRHQQFLERLKEMLKTDDKVDRFRSLTTAYRNNSIDAETYVKEIVQLCQNNVDIASKVFKGVEDLMDREDKKWEIVRTWRNTQTQLQNFPMLAPSDPRPTGHGTSSRVLVIKGGSTRVGGTKTTSKNRAGVWDRVASAATGASTGTSNRSAASPVRPSSPATYSTPSFANPRNKTAWSRSSAAEQRAESAVRAARDFPSLPPAAPKHPTLLSMRRNASETQLNAWSDRGSDSGSVTEEPPSLDYSKKKKGKKGKQVLFRVGL